MKEASLVKFYFVRYFFLGFGLLQGIAAFLLLLEFQSSPKSRFAFFVFFALALILFSAHALFFSRIKRVVIQKKKVVVQTGRGLKEFDWSKVKEVKHLPFLNMYSLKIKGKRKIYFLPGGDTAAVFGFIQTPLELIPKKINKTS